MSTTKVGVIIGRWQPLHNGHLKLIKRALKASDVLIVIIGSARIARSIRNPFTYAERERLVNNVVTSLTKQKKLFYILSSDDILYDNSVEWENSIRNSVYYTLANNNIPIVIDGDSNITLFGTAKDHTTQYLDGFAGWKHNIKYDPKATGLTGTLIRKAMFTNKLNTIKSLVPEMTYGLLSSYANMAKVKYGPGWDLAQEYKYAEQYIKDNQKNTFPTIFQTVDNVIVDNGNVLMIKRGHQPSVGQWGLPGGFINEYETLMDAAARETKEETNIDVYVHSDKTRALIESKTYDYPFRSIRGRIITTAFLWNITGWGHNEAKAGDDAAEIKWVPIKDIIEGTFLRDLIVEDHWCIIYDLYKRHKLIIEFKETK